MRSGDFTRAWTIADRDLARLRGSGAAKHEGPRHLQRIWRGESLAGKAVLVRCYHGLGDTIQFARFLPALKNIAREVIVWCQPPLLDLIAQAPGVDRVLPLHDGAPGVPFEVDIEIMELPHALRAGRDLVEMRAPYLTPGGAPAGPRSFVTSCDVGLVWKVGAWDKRREVPGSALRQLALPGVRLFSLQRDVPARDVIDTGAVDVSTADIDGLASRLRELDLLISVDTMVAHLAGALDREVWIMLHADCDWRWPEVGDRTYWYPQARLFRQQTAGSWCSVIAEIQSALQARLASRQASPWRPPGAGVVG
ncbi:MAG: hypothetical protein ABW213_13330 [Tardiphaga sp.]